MTQESSLPANHFILSGHDVQIIYDTTSITGKPLLTYQNAQTSFSFTGDEIRTQSTEIGMLVSVTLGNITFPVRNTLNILIPTILLATATETITFKTVAILSDFLTEPPTSSVEPKYQIVNLHGIASIIIS